MQKVIKIDGMSCSHCVMAVRNALAELPLKIISVTIGYAEIEYDTTEISLERIKKAITESGYQVSEP